MQHLSAYLTENADKAEKNLHLEHLEDQVLNRGMAGARESLNFLHALRDMLVGHVDAPVNVTTKWDGSPSVFCGINPENDRFFVGLKGIFSKDAKLNYTEKDVDQHYDNEILREKLKACLRYLPKLGIKNILQGDMMFTKEDILIEGVEGEKYVTFTPNTITYAIPADTTLAARIRQAALGIVFHTEYHGTSMATLKSSFNVDIGHLTHTKDVWFRDASFVDQSGTVTFTKDELTSLDWYIQEAENMLQTINSKILNQIALTNTYRNLVKMFNNSKIRTGEIIADTTTHTNELIRWIDNRLTQEMRDAKLPATQAKRTQQKTMILGFFRAHAADVNVIFILQNILNSAKMVILRKLNQMQHTKTFLRTPDGLKVTNPEGFVAVDHIGNAVKLVDRLQFSHANFTAAKDWH